MRRRSLTLAVAVTAITCSGTLATRAEDWKATGEYDWHDAGGRVYELEKGHTYWVGELAGKFFSNKGKGSLLDQAEVKCFGFTDADTNNKRSKQGGYCIWTDADGDHAYSVWEANDTLGFEVNISAIGVATLPFNCMECYNSSAQGEEHEAAGIHHARW
jgi:hypothetical protein